MFTTIYNPEKMFTRIRGFAYGADLQNTKSALNYARSKHEGQKRKSGEPYIVHPLLMACNAIALGLRDDVLIATILLHDVCEDCSVEVHELPVRTDVRRAVELITFRVMEGETKEQAKKRYYDQMLQNREAVIAKLIDRCHNVSSMAGTFSSEKLIAYIDETHQYVYPLLRKAKELYPEYADAVFILKYQMTSVVESIEETIRVHNHTVSA